MRAACTLGCLLLLTTPAAARAQSATPPPDQPPAAAAPTPSQDRQGNWLSRNPTRLYVGMWTTHLKHDVIVVDSNWAVGFTHRGYFLATFRNSFGRQAFTAGIQHAFVTRRRGRLTSSLGGRLGAVYGYDGRFMRIARDTPVLPLFQAWGNVDVGRIGIEVSYTFVVVSVTTSYRF
jgi:hypothetical protein